MSNLKQAIKHLQALEAKATPEPWVYSHNGMLEPPTLLRYIKTKSYRLATFVSSDADAQLVAHLRHALPKLIKTIMVLTDALEEISNTEKPQFDGIEWIDSRACRISDRGLKQAEDLWKV